MYDRRNPARTNRDNDRVVYPNSDEICSSLLPLPSHTRTPTLHIREIPTATSTPTIENSPTPTIENPSKPTAFLLPAKSINGAGVITSLWYRDPKTDEPIEVDGSFDLDHGKADTGTPDDIIVSTTCASMCFDEWAAIHGAKYIWFDDETTSVDLCVRSIPQMTTKSTGWPLRSSICVLTNQGNISLLSDFHIYEVPNGESWNFHYQTWLSSE